MDIIKMIAVKCPSHMCVIPYEIRNSKEFALMLSNNKEITIEYVINYIGLDVIGYFLDEYYKINNYSVDLQTLKMFKEVKLDSEMNYASVVNKIDYLLRLELKDKAIVQKIKDGSLESSAQLMQILSDESFIEIALKEFFEDIVLWLPVVSKNVYKNMEVIKILAIKKTQSLEMVPLEIRNSIDFANCLANIKDLSFYNVIDYIGPDVMDLYAQMYFRNIGTVPKDYELKRINSAKIENQNKFHIMDEKTDNNKFKKTDDELDMKNYFKL